MPYSLVQGTNGNGDIKCPAPVFVAECTDKGTCFCVCKDPETCPSTAKVLIPEEAAKLFKEAVQWVNNGSPWSLAQIPSKPGTSLAQVNQGEIKCPAPVFVAQCTDA